jgi:thioredoxin-like negative regulator of GroEL
MLRNIAKLNIAKSLVASAQRNVSTSSRLFDIFKVQDEKDFEERVLKSKNVVVVDFMATWCAPCNILGPRIETVIEENKGKVSLAKVSAKLPITPTPYI